MSRFRAVGREVEVMLSSAEAAVLARLPDLLADAGVRRSDPAWQRLNPTIYADDDGASREFERFAARERTDARAADQERFAQSLKLAAAGPTVLSREDAAAWSRVIGEARVVVAARRGLFDSGLPDQIPKDPEIALVLLLGYVQEELVTELLQTMEDQP
jgi:hypothetical protein